MERNGLSHHTQKEPRGTPSTYLVTCEQPTGHPGGQAGTTQRERKDGKGKGGKETQAGIRVWLLRMGFGKKVKDSGLRLGYRVRVGATSRVRVRVPSPSRRRRRPPFPPPGILSFSRSFHGRPVRLVLLLQWHKCCGPSCGKPGG